MNVPYIVDSIYDTVGKVVSCTWFTYVNVVLQYHVSSRHSNQNLVGSTSAPLSAGAETHTHAPCLACLLTPPPACSYLAYSFAGTSLSGRLFPVASIHLLLTLLSLPTCRRKVHKAENKSRSRPNRRAVKNWTRVTWRSKRNKRLTRRPPPRWRKKWAKRSDWNCPFLRLKPSQSR